MRNQSLFRSFTRQPAEIISSCLRILAVLACGMAAQPVWGQDDEIPTPQFLRGGLKIRKVSAYAAYYSDSLPTSGGIQALSRNLGADLAAGGSARIGWAKYSERSNFSLSYSPSYTGRVRYSEWNALNHAFSLDTGRNVTPRLNLTFSIGADLSNLDQFLFAPTAFSAVASVPATFEDVSAAMLGRNVSNPQLASALSAASLPDSPARNLIYGERVLMAAMESRLSYSWSPRLSVILRANSRRYQRVSEDRLGAVNSAFIPDTTSVGGGLDVSYSLSPVTQLGGAVETSRIVSERQDVYVTTSTVSVGRAFAKRWFVDVYGGVGVATPVRQTSFYRLSTRPRPVAGGRVGFKSYSHIILGDYRRIVSDAYGIGAETTSYSSGSWTWGRPGRVWWLNSSFSWEQLQGTGVTLVDNSSSRATIGLGRNVGRQTALLVEYAFLRYVTELQRTRHSSLQSAVRLSVMWNPESFR
jgi:hypothetical protein